MAETKRPKILLYDLETSLQLVSVFQLAHNDWINPDAIVQERYIISASWKWLEEDKVYSASVLDDKKRFSNDPNDDTHVLNELHKVMLEADAVVYHNGNAFDHKYMETRMLIKGFSPLPPITQLDTIQIAKSRFLFNSNKLDYLGKMLGVGQKTETHPGLWMRALQGDVKAIKEMIEYNKNDVKLLERIFLKLRPYMPNHINRQLFGHKEGCPRCGSLHVQSRGEHHANTRVYQRYQCSDCGGWFRELKSSSGAKTRVL